MLRRLTLLLCVAWPVAAAAAPPREVVAVIPPAADGDAFGLGLVMQARAEALLVRTGRYQDVHAKMILRVAGREGIPATALASPRNAALIASRLGTQRSVASSLAEEKGGWRLKAIALVGDKPDPMGVSVDELLPGTLPEAVEAGGLLLAKLASGPDKVDASAPPRVLTKSVPALAAYGRCYATLVLQPIGIETPVVLDEKGLKQAVTDCRAAVDADPLFQDARAALGLALALGGQDADAVAMLAQCTEKDAYLPLYWLGRYWLVTRYQSPEKGATALEKAIERHPYFLLAYGYLAEHHSALRADAAALTAWRAYLAQVPKSTFIRGRVSHSLARSGKQMEGLSEARAALDADPTNREAKLKLASREVDAERWADAIAILEPLAIEADTRPEILLRLGYAYMRKGDAASAQKWLRKAEDLAGRPSDWRTRARARLDLGLLLVKNGQVDEGQQLLVASVDGGLRSYVAAQKDEEIKRVVADAEKAQRGKKALKFKLERPKEASPFEMNDAGEVISPTNRSKAQPKMFEVLRF